MSNDPATYPWQRAGGHLPILLALCLGTQPLAVAVQLSTRELRTAESVRLLTVEQAEGQVPVRLRGVVTFFDEALYGRYIQDETAGIYLNLSTNIPPLVPGQQVEVIGVTSPGEYAPAIDPKQVLITGEATLPNPKPVTFQQLASGHEDSQFVEISGIVRSVEMDEPTGYYLIEIVTGGGRLPVYAPKLPVESLADLVNSTIRVRGVCSTLFNHQRQLFAVRLLVPRPDDLVIEVPAPAEPFAMESRPLISLLQFTQRESYNNRVKVEGIVTYFEPGRELFLQKGMQALQVETKQKEPLSVGDRVEVLGFASQGEYSPVLQDALYRKISSGEPPAPLSVTRDAMLRGVFNSMLIRISARLLDRAPSGVDRYLILQDGDFIFQALLSHPGGPDPFAELENRSTVEVTGICRVVPGDWEAGEEWRAKSFSVLLRSPSDVVVVKAPPWWTFGKVLLIAGVLGVVTLAAFGWVAVLRRQVAERGIQLEAQIQERQRAEQQRLIEQERTRVAQDLHDELGATLTEVTMLSSLARTTPLPVENKEHYLEQISRVSRSLVTTLDEIVWAINPKYDTVDSLASYYSLFAQRLLNLAGMSCRLQVAESFPEIPLDSRLRHGAFLAFKEALNNAIRHSGASEVLIALNAAAGWLNITVADNGRGFDSTAGLPGSDGLTNMRQRMEKLGGQCRITSQPGSGTTIQFRLPLEKEGL
jgi:signal transduction histidine kinase